MATLGLVRVRLVPGAWHAVGPLHLAADGIWQQMPWVVCALQSRLAIGWMMLGASMRADCVWP